MGENIRVACRVRPLNSAEVGRGNSIVVSFPGDTKAAIALGGKTFNFDHVIEPAAEQVEVYDTVAKPIVDDVLNGYNGTIFAYGQTSSGKTFTMEGVLNDPVLQGIIPRIIRDIFDHIYQMDVSLEFHIKVSYFEIYLDKIRDLLDVSKTNLSVHEDKDRVPFVKGATERFVSSPEEVFDVIDEAKANRHVAVTNMNEYSSRSHSIFMITLQQLNTETQKKLHGKLYLVDLAGSEKVSKTGAEGTVLDEAKNINKSLSALGNVINSLVENSQHIPYRDSKLTRILQESLGGNARTTMIICCSPADYNESETKSTLMFGMRAKTIKNCVTVNEELTADEWRRRYEREHEKNLKMRAIIGQLEAELDRWRSGESVDKTDWFTKDQYAAVEADEALLEQPAGSASSGIASASSLSLASSAAAPTNPALSASSYTAPKPSPRPQVKAAAELTEQQLLELYKELDDKDDEINKLGQTLSRLKDQLDEQDLLMRSLRDEKDSTLQENGKLLQEVETSKEESKEMLQALEELANSYNVKEQELTARVKEFDEAQEFMQVSKSELLERNSEIKQHKDSLVQMRKKYGEMLGLLCKETAELAETLNEQLKQHAGATPTTATTTTMTQPLTPLAGQSAPQISSTSQLDEEFTKLRLQITKLKSEARVILGRVKELEDERSTQTVTLRRTEEDSRELRIRVQESDLRITHLNEKVEESETRKRGLQDHIDKINAELSMLKANEQVLGGSKQNEILASQRDIQTKLDEELKRQATQHQQQVKELRDQAADYERKTEEQKNEIAHMEFQNQSISKEREQLQTQLDEAGSKLERLELNEERRLQAHKDLETVQQTVAKELEVLHSQRRLWIEQITERMRAKKQATRRKATKASDLDAPADEAACAQPIVDSEAVGPALPTRDEVDEAGDQVLFAGNMVQQAKIAYLEGNFSKLNKIHKELLRSRHEMRIEMVRMEKRHRAAVERMATLEASLKDAKEGAIRDRKRYNYEIEKIREAMRTRMPRRTAAPQIVKSIRGGNHAGLAGHSISGGGGALASQQSAAVTSSSQS